MNKKILNSTIPTTQNSNNLKQTKKFIINLGTATQLTLGGSGNQCESKPRQIYIKYC